MLQTRVFFVCVILKGNTTLYVLEELRKIPHAWVLKQCFLCCQNLILNQHDQQNRSTHDWRRFVSGPTSLPFPLPIILPCVMLCSSHTWSSTLTAGNWFLKHYSCCHYNWIQGAKFTLAHLPRATKNGFRQIFLPACWFARWAKEH